MKLRVFKCDNCDTQTAPRNENNIEGFPYHEGWVYVYELSIKKHSTKQNRVMQFNLHDKHFCAMKCALDFIEKLGEE